MTNHMTRLWAGLVLAMLAAFMWAVAIILSKITLEAIPSNTVFVVQLVAATMVAGTLQYYLAFHFYLVAMKMIPVHLAGMMLYLVPVFSISLAWLVLGERLSSIQLFGCLVILGAIAILNRQQASDSANT